MISVARADGQLLRVFPSESGAFVLGYHPVHGLIGDSSYVSRRRIRRRYGVAAKHSASERGWAFQFRVERAKTGVALHALAGCAVEGQGSSWKVLTSIGELRIAHHAETATVGTDFRVSEAPTERKSNDYILPGLALLLFLAAGAFLMIPRNPDLAAVQAETELPPVQIIQPEKKHEATPPREAPKPPVVDKAKIVRRAIQQDLGFLGLLGKKDLKSAIGGMPSKLKEASAGAGAGGLQGSGGEVLVGLGQGVKRVTVGNSGTVGLGGIGTKGAGGGLGGYGNVSVGSGEGKALSSVPLSNDMTLEGGLDRSVIQATIAKYLSQVRSCYEQGLQRQPGLAGQVLTHFVIDGLGDVIVAKVAGSTLGDPGVESCIAGRMLGWKFPKPVGGVNVKVDYPFVLRPVKT